MTPPNLLAGDCSHNIHQFVDTNEPILPEIDRLSVIGHHEAIDAFDAVVDVAIRARLIAVAPHLDLVAVARARDLAADRCW